MVAAITPEIRANQVLNTYWDGKLPVDVEAISTRAGIKVQRKLPKTDEETGYEISGRIDTDSQGNRIITVSSTDPLNRQRFTIAHELGHHFMEHGDRHRKDTFIINIKDPQERQKEWEANEFAAALLMPKQTLGLVLDKMDNPTISKFAQVFEVSEQAMRIRLQRLGMIG